MKKGSELLHYVSIPGEKISLKMALFESLLYVLKTRYLILWETITRAFPLSSRDVTNACIICSAAL